MCQSIYLTIRAIYRAERRSTVVKLTNQRGNAVTGNTMFVQTMHGRANGNRTSKSPLPVKARALVFTDKRGCSRVTRSQQVREPTNSLFISVSSHVTIDGRCRKSGNLLSTDNLRFVVNSRHFAVLTVAREVNTNRYFAVDGRFQTTQQTRTRFHGHG